MAGFVINASRHASSDSSKASGQVTKLFLDENLVLSPTHSCKVPVNLFSKKAVAKVTHPSEDPAAKYASFFLVAL